MAQALPDTIFALSSGLGRAGIAVVRISGPRALATLNSMAGTTPQQRYAVVRKIRTRDGQIIDAKAGANTDKLNQILDTDEGARYFGEG